jgi:3-oxoacyl-[acyl-carrier-protein] synthase II
MLSRRGERVETIGCSRGSRNWYRVRLQPRARGLGQNDQAEARGLRRVFGDRAGGIPVASIQSMVGHCLAAAGAIEAAALALSLDRGVVPLTIHYRKRDPECDLDVVANEARELPIACGLSISLASGGNDTALVMRRAD